LEKFRVSTIGILQQIDWQTHGFDTDLLNGVDLNTAVVRWFPDLGTRTGRCEAFGGCFYRPLCDWPGREAQTLSGFVSRTSDEVTKYKKRTG